MDPEGLSWKERPRRACLSHGGRSRFTLLNPHVYFDTLFLIGGASTGFSGDERIAFGIGASAASFLFFFSIGYGARRLSRYWIAPMLGESSTGALLP